MTEILEIGFARDKKIGKGINFFGRIFVEQLAWKNMTLFPNFVVIGTKSANFFSDIYNTFFFEIKQGDETHGYI